MPGTAPDSFVEPGISKACGGRPTAARPKCGGRGKEEDTDFTDFHEFGREKIQGNHNLGGAALRGSKFV